MPMSDIDIDIFNPDDFAKGMPYDTFGRLRAETPVYFQATPIGYRGYWALTRYADIINAIKDPIRFSSARGGTTLDDHEDEDLNLIRLLMVNMDPPQQNKFRRLVSQGFTPRTVALIEPQVRAAAASIIDQAAEKLRREGQIDFVNAIAVELPLVFITLLLGVPHEDRHRLMELTNRLIGFDDPELNTSVADARIAAAEIWQYADGLADIRRREPSDDLLSVLLAAKVDGMKLTPGELEAFFLLLAFAGNETTRNLISGGLLALLQHPSERTRLAANPTLLPSAIEEMLRWVSPIILMRRTATCDIELHGQKIQEGDKIALYFASANRDEAVFAKADLFDITRAPNDHIAFGYGTHFCLGASLARLEIRVLFEELFRRMPEIELAGPVRRLRSNLINGYKEIPIRSRRRV